MPRTQSKPASNSAKPSVIRDAINNRLNKLGLTRYQFAKSGKVSAAASTVYRFLNGEVESSSGNLDEMFDALGLKIVSTKHPNWAVKARKSRTERLTELGRDPKIAVAPAAVTASSAA